MSKIKLNLTLKTNIEVINKEFVGILIDNKIVYNDDNVNVTFLLGKSELTMRRCSEDYDVDFVFSNNNLTKCVYNVKSNNIIICLDIKTKNLIIDKNRLFVDYELYQQDELIEAIEFEIIYGVI